MPQFPNGSVSGKCTRREEEEDDVSCSLYVEIWLQLRSGAERSGAGEAEAAAVPPPIDDDDLEEKL